MNADPGKLISILYRKSQIYWTKVLKDYELSSSEYPVLILLYQRDGRTQEEISSDLEIDKSAIARVIQSLLDKGFIEKKKDEYDKRCNRIYLTKKGEQSEPVIKKGIKEWNYILTEHVPEEEEKEISRLLSLMVENLRKQSEKKE